MNSHVKELWVNALRSGKYAQTKGCLHNPQGYCCLGVLCDLYIQEDPFERTWNILTNDGCKVYRYCLDSNEETLPSSVMNWAELKNSNPMVTIVVNDEETEEQTLAELNDFGNDFVKIAELIEKQL